MTAFVTGGSGFVGGAILRRLAAEGREIRALVRSDAAAATVSALGASPVLGDLDDPDGLADAMRGCDAVFHVAGSNRTCPRGLAKLYAVNVDGAVAVVRAAARAGVPRVVHTSSSATIGERVGEIGREDTAHAGTFLSHYARSKFLGERAVLALGPEIGVEVVSVNPSSVQGPGRDSGSARLLIKVARSRTAVLIRSCFSVVDVDDCAAAHAAAELLGTSGERYLVSGASLTMDEAVALVRAATGRPDRVVWVPSVLAHLAQPIAAVSARLDRGSDAVVCPALIRTLLHGHRYDARRSERELGVTYRAVRETLERALAWYMDRGMLGRRPA
jgi:dihydroflavonol-4-reductase